ncbi:MAG: hypothetical protein JWN57_1579 [Frankiales bacterium]|jgi:hypothetical protein|nr:hypothetical protein [Frankiales bacterium]
MAAVSGRAGIRGGRPTRGFPPGSAQALVAVVLGLVLTGVGLQRGDVVWALVFAGVAALGAAQLVRLLRR